MKIVFDECFSRDGAAAIGQIFRLHDPPISCAFLVDEIDQQGVHDEHWAPRFRDQGVVVISRDRGRSRRSRNKGMPLPQVLPRERVTGVFLSGGLGEATRVEMVRAVVAVIPDLLSECPRAEPGTRFRVRRHRGQSHLIVWPTGKGRA